ncbi:hypothetical protein GCM10020358_02700 [Amorphoplanes nipponensis]|uniref:DUF1707 domain-containing protein n=2 Tax=Actinoplanes nipponensis TaxID=135950 RepID=A0A919JMX3_9ACTN|nr:hypothetical protein Ani05nite_75330 [Actinoplanes nipponensis]
MSMRASDEDRQRIVAALERHTGAGRLTLDEFAQRVGLASAARTLEELAAVVSDLPAETPEEKQRRELLLVFAVALITLVLLGVALALR